MRFPRKWHSNLKPIFCVTNLPIANTLITKHQNRSLKFVSIIFLKISTNWHYFFTANIYIIKYQILYSLSLSGVECYGLFRKFLFSLYYIKSRIFSIICHLCVTFYCVTLNQLFVLHFIELKYNMLC